tara:strand:- start:353 stop:562 length:210 start_codon:yes stop_codon:yes gene_type:complete
MKIQSKRMATITTNGIKSGLYAVMVQDHSYVGFRLVSSTEDSQSAAEDIVECGGGDRMADRDGERLFGL